MNIPNKVLLVAGPLEGLGGSEYLAVSLARLLQSYGVAVHIVVGTHPQEVWIGELCKAHVEAPPIRISHSSYESPVDVCAHICRILDAEAIDLLQLMFLEGVAHEWLRNKPRSVSTIALEPTDMSNQCWWLKPMAPAVIARLDGLIVLNTEAAKNASQHWCYKGPLRVLPNLCLTGVSCPTNAEDPQSVGCISRLSAEKGLEYLWAAFATCVRVFPKARLKVWGAGPDQERLEQLAVMLGIRQNIDLKGSFNPYEDITSICNACGVFAHSSLFEGAPVALLELAARGRPVVATRTAGAIKVLGRSYPFLVPIADPNAMANSLIRLLSDSSTSLHISHLLRRQFQSHFCLDRSGPQWIDAYEYFHSFCVAK